jgi:hypothetical protein
MKSTLEKSAKSTEDTKKKVTKNRARITFRLYKIDRNLPREEIQDSLDLNTEDIILNIYKFILETKESVSNLDKLYDKHCNKLSITDVVEIENNQGVSSFYYLDLFGFIEIEEFDSRLVNNKTLE